MKYSVKYDRNFRFLNEVDEIIIDYKNKDGELIRFMETVPKAQRVVVKIIDTSLNIEDNIAIIAAAADVHSNMAVLLPTADMTFISYFQEKKIPFFFDRFVNEWDTFMSYVELGVSDIYIVNELAFEMPEVSRICKEHNILIRTFPNVSQMSNTTPNLNKLKSFFIRPEDISIYEPYVDVCEFFGPINRQSVLYEIYKNERWMGDLEEIIIGLNYSIPNQSVIPAFGEQRLNCRKDCYRGKCIVCDKIVSIAKNLNQAQVILKVNNK
jgi:hypothetical protein